MSTPEIEHRLGTIRRIASSARNGHPESILQLANEILTLDAQLATGAMPPAAWRPKFDGEAAEQHLVSYDETCRDYRDEQDNPTGVADSRAYEYYEDGLTTVVHDLATSLRAALAEIESLRRPVPEATLPMPAAGTVAGGDEVRCPHIEDGEACGHRMEMVERIWDYREVSWEESQYVDGNPIVLMIGDSNLGDGEEWALTCSAGHVFATPDGDESVEYR